MNNENHRNNTVMTLIESLPEQELDKLVAEAKDGGIDLEPTLQVLRREKNRRLALAVAAEQADLSHGVYVWSPDDSEQPTNPIHLDSVWKQDFEDN